MFAVSSTKRGIPEKPVVLEGCPFWFYMVIRNNVFMV